MIAVIDYRMGNLMSVERGLRYVGGDAHITSDPAVIAKADAVVLPGVGAFADASRHMIELGQMEVVRKRIAEGAPFLGICLGLQLLHEASEEGAVRVDATGEAVCEETALADTETVLSPDGTLRSAAGIGVIPGWVKRMPSNDTQGDHYKIPHVGWNTIDFDADAAIPLFKDIEPGEYFYFTHSYMAVPNETTIATTTHSVPFACAARFGERAYGVQFHPEKSSTVGAQMLRNFLSII